MKYFEHKQGINDMEKQQAVENLVDICHHVQEKGLVSGTGGNISIKTGNVIYITPTSVALGKITDKLLSVVSIETGKPLNDITPSKEIMMHLLSYRANENIHAIIHVHSVYAAAIASIPDFIHDKTIPAYTPGYGLRVGCLPVIPYEIPGSMELAQSVATVLKERNSVLLANHGSVVAAKNLEKALDLVEEIEENAKLFFITNGKANPLSREQIQTLHEYYK